MSTAAEMGTGWTPWTEPLYQRFPAGPFRIGGAIVFVTLAVLIVISWAAGDLEHFGDDSGRLLYERDIRLGLIICVLLAFVPTAQSLLLRATRANLAALGGSGDAPPLRLPRPSFLRFTLPGALAMPLIALSVDRNPAIYVSSEYLASPAHPFQWICGVTVTIAVAHLAHLSLACARAVRDRADARVVVDLLDLSALAPLARQSVQTLLVWLLMLSIFAVNTVDAGFVAAVLIMGLLSGVIATAVFLICNRAVHQRIREAKYAETQRINAALRGGATAMESLAVSHPGRDLTTADLLAYRSFVDDVREWAFDSSAWLRMALYLAIPLGSWLGGAVVERLLDASLG